MIWAVYPVSHVLRMCLDLGSLGNRRISRTPSVVLTGCLFCLGLRQGLKCPVVKDDLELLNLISCVNFPNTWTADMCVTRLQVDLQAGPPEVKRDWERASRQRNGFGAIRKQQLGFDLIKFELPYTNSKWLVDMQISLYVPPPAHLIQLISVDPTGLDINE